MTREEFKNEMEKIMDTIFSMKRFYMDSSLKYCKDCSFEINTGYVGYYDDGTCGSHHYRYKTVELFYEHRSTFYYHSKFKNERILPKMIHFMYDNATTEELRKLLDKLKMMIIEKL